MSDSTHNPAVELVEDFSAVINKEALPNEGKGSFVPRVASVLTWAKHLAWYSLKKTAYLILVVAAVVAMLAGIDKAAEMALKMTPLAYVYPKDFAFVKKDLTTPVPHYDYDLNPGVCILHNQVKGNRYEYANNAGFRDPRPIPLVKPDDEFRIFLTGGSTAFGLGAAGQAAGLTNFYYIEHRETIAYVLEQILNATAPIPGKKIRVYNTAVWGYSYQHLLFRYVTKLRRYKPDMIVSLDGVNEIGPVIAPDKDWDYFRQGQFNGVLREIFAYNRPGLGAYATLWLKNNTFLMTLLWKGIDPFITIEGNMRMHQTATSRKDAASASTDMSDEERSRMVTANSSAVVKVIEDYHAVLENDGVPHIFALQPLLYLSKKPRHTWENKIEPLEEHKYIYDAPSDHLYKYLAARISDSAHRRQYFLVDFSEYFDDTSEWVFTDWCHLTAGANYLIAREFANIIKERYLQIPLSEGDRVESKDSFFWNPMLTANIVYAPPPITEDKDPKNMLTGYPGTGVYSSKQVAQSERLEIVLDLNRTFPLSRLRLVWDDDSVPEEWAVDVSLDGETWKPWVQGTDKKLDNLSWWPDYEFYGSEPVQARFLRYRPTKAQNRSICLRSWTVQR